MPIVDRNSYSDAEKRINLLLLKHGDSQTLAGFLSDKIEYANRISRNNWNLNLALNGKFLRFNVGQEYCIQIDEMEILILCLRQFIPETVRNNTDALHFRGYNRDKGKVNSPIFNEVPDCLAKVPDSIGVVITENAERWLPLIDEGNSRFISHAISVTRILPMMIGAHSVGAVDFLSDITGRHLPNPSFALNSVHENEILISRKIKKLSDEQLQRLTQKEQSRPRKMTTNTSLYIRNPYIIERAKRSAAGRCQDCGQSAPFINRLTGEPFLEVHHIVPLSEGGEDSIDNVVALCPNCHRKRHYG